MFLYLLYLKYILLFCWRWRSFVGLETLINLYKCRLFLYTPMNTQVFNNNKHFTHQPTTIAQQLIYQTLRKLNIYKVHSIIFTSSDCKQGDHTPFHFHAVSPPVAGRFMSAIQTRVTFRGRQEVNSAPKLLQPENILICYNNKNIERQKKYGH